MTEGEPKKVKFVAPGLPAVPQNNTHCCFQSLDSLSLSKPHRNNHPHSFFINRLCFLSTTSWNPQGYGEICSEEKSGTVIDSTPVSVYFVSKGKEIVTNLGLPCVLKPSSWLALYLLQREKKASKTNKLRNKTIHKKIRFTTIK